MRVRKISNYVSYVGVNDRSTEKFESLWPIPNGVSYNSYLVCGSEKTALIDTVELGHSRNFLQTLREEAGVEKIDYLVINHMEPDHSGGISAVIAAFPEIKIIGNRTTLQMIRGFYHIDDEDRFIVIKDGEEVSLGDRTLRFYLTPMVHWPETMMTYCQEERMVFSGDAFGTFGALNGGLVDDDMECGPYIEEMYRYYSNIVGKYGRSVENALKKLSGIEFDYICSTHGPVWHAMKEKVIDITSRLARYESEKGVTIIYGSMYGNTADMAEFIASELNRHGVKNIHVHNAANASMSQMISDAFRYEGLIVGSPTYSNDVFPPVAEFMRAMELREMKNKVVACFGNNAWAPAAAKKLEEAMNTMPVEDLGCVKMQYSLNSQNEDEAAELIKTFVSHLKQ